MGWFRAVDPARSVTGPLFLAGPAPLDSPLCLTQGAPPDAHPHCAHRRDPRRGAALPLAAVASAQPAGRDCRDFASQADAQSVLRLHSGDPAQLDADHDGIACEDYFGRDAPDTGDGSIAPPDTTPSHAAPLDTTPPGLLAAGLGAMAAVGAAYLVVRRSPRAWPADRRRSRARRRSQVDRADRRRGCHVRPPTAPCPVPGGGGRGPGRAAVRRRAHPRPRPAVAAEVTATPPLTAVRPAHLPSRRSPSTPRWSTSACSPTARCRFPGDGGVALRGAGRCASMITDFGA